MELSEKIERITAIKDEVADLHQLLKNVLPKFPGVISHEYTHGQFERGADFIVEIESATTLRRSHIGVVVKCGKISSAKATEVEEQIRECAEERNYKVLQKVRCSTVWVFASGGYSERAKEKLHARLPGRSIEFFDATDIAQYVDKYFAYYWNDMPTEIGEYLQTTLAKVKLLDQSSLLIGNGNGDGKDLYIELDTYEKVTKGYSNISSSRPSVKNVDFFKEIYSTKLGILEAEMGFGKSRLSRKLAAHLCNTDTFRKAKLLPIFITYRSFIDIYQENIVTLITTELSSAWNHVEAGDAEVLVILDGIDECSSKGRTSADIFEALRTQLHAFSNIRALVTTRPIRSITDKAALYHEARTFGIRPLSLAKIIRYLEDSCKKTNLPSRLFEDLKKSSLFKQLPHSPIAAALFSNLLSRSQHEVPQSLTELYAKSLDLMLGRWDLNKELATEKQFKTAQLIAEQLGCYFIDNKLAYVSVGEVKGIIHEYLSKRNTGVTEAEVTELLLNRSTVFSIDEDRNTVSFRHRSFSEYLYALKRSKDRSLKVANAALDPYWVNIFFFYVGTLSDCPEILTELQQISANSETEEWMRLISVPSYLLAAYQTEYAVVEENIKVTFLESARLYIKVRQGDTNTKLKDLSEMHLLYLFKTLIIESFGYEFFQNGLESALLRVFDQLDDQELKDYAMFFLACATGHSGVDSGFKLLIENRGADKLPVPISLAIRCELESSTSISNSSLLKEHRSKLIKTLSGTTKKGARQENMSLHNQIADLFEKPLTSRQKKISKGSQP